jgi:cytochrome c-type biogenesis protein CcsB
MRKILARGSKATSVLFTSTATGFYMLIFAAAIAVATFIENDYGTSAAQKVVFKAWWFELLLLLFAITLVVNVVRYRMVTQKKWALVIFHLSMVIIIAGAGLTRYFGREGMMHIREGAASNIIYTSEAYLNFIAESNGQLYEFAEPVLFATKGSNRLSREYQLGNDVVQVDVLSIIPNPEQKLVPAADGKPTLKVVFGGANGREEYFLQAGDQQRINGVLFNFTSEIIAEAVNIGLADGELWLQTNRDIHRTVMADRSESDLPAGQKHPLKLRAMHDMGTAQFVFGDFVANGSYTVAAGDSKLDRESTIGINLLVRIGEQSFERTIYGNAGSVGNREIFETENLRLAISYGAKIIELPFSLFLHDFIMERYPGTESPASYASEVTLVDARENLEMPYRIYMNNILTHDGYRFFQSSYDQDEQGTYLSVNDDFWGTLVTYIGYALLTLGMVLIFFSPNTRFSQLAKSLKKMRANRAGGVILLILFSAWQNPAMAQQNVAPTLSVVSEAHADQFSRMVVQDFRGRMKPLHTLTRELLRKVAGKESVNGQTADQVVLSMYVNPSAWYAVPLINLGKSEKIAALLGLKGEKTAAYRDFFTTDGTYKLGDEVVRANNTNPAERGVYENQLIKVDERVNIVNMVFSGSLLRIVPLANDPANTWAAEPTHNHETENPNVAAAFFNAYKSSLREALGTGDYSLPNTLLTELAGYQNRSATQLLPSKTKLNAEILLNNWSIFNRLAGYYALLGLVYLALLFLSVFKPNLSLKKVHLVLTGFVVLGFAFQTFGLGMRWYVSGRAPWSNGYESMIYIAWTSALAGLLFARKSLGGMAATLVLSGTVLLIAMLSYLDPEITPLVPVLKSYWLTIHVSLEAGSYGFLMLGAIIGLINLLLLLFITQKNKKRVRELVQEMTHMGEMTMIGGIVMMSIGTYLGGVWANESWGRYWGWDAKETWALVSILVYAFILHMRLIPKLNSLFAFNFASLFGLSSIIMTYFGVNYYLSGLHSYAAGDPVPIPDWVYISVACLMAISLGAYVRFRQVLKS